MLRVTRRYITMSSAPPRPPLIVVVGATGSGKSQVGLSHYPFGYVTESLFSLLYL